MAQSNDQLLRDAIALAQANKRAEARQIILNVIQNDEENSRAWMLLARVTTDQDERRTALINVTNLEPFNTKAQEALAELEGKLAISRAIGDNPETRERTSRMRRNIIFAVIGVMLLMVVGVVVLVVIGNNQQAAKMAEIAEFNAMQTGTSAAVTLVAQVTETAEQVAILGITETYFAFPTATFTPRPTLPPESTPTPTITPTPTATRIAAPSDLPGQILGWGGRVDVIGERDFPIVFISVQDGSIMQLSGINRGQHVTASSVNRIVYQRYFRDAFRSEISKLDAITGISEVMSSEWTGTTMTMGETAWPQLNADGTMLIFSAVSAREGTRDIYLYNSALEGEKLRRLTNDGSNYDMPTISPDGWRIAAVRTGRAPNPLATDLVMIDVASGTIEQLTSDGDSLLEAQPRWSPDGKLVAYVSFDPATNNGDIYLRTVEGMVNVLPVTRSANVDEQFPVFSPDSRYMAYSSNLIDGYNIFIYDLLTGAFYQLTYEDDVYYPGAWLP